MAGLLDGLLNDDTFRLGMGLLAAGSARSDGAGTGQRLMEGLGYLDSYKAKKKQSAFDDLKMEEAKAAIEQQKALRAAATQSMISPDMANAMSMGPMQDGGAMPTVQPGFDNQGYINKLFGMGMPDKAIAHQQSLQKENKRYVVDGSLVDQNGNAVFTAPTANKDPEDIRKLKMIYGDGTPAYQSALQKLGGKLTTHTPGTVVNNINSQESEQSKTYGKAVGETRAEIAKAGFNAPATIAQLDRMDELMQGVEGGKFAPTGLEIASAAKSLGINLDPNLGNKEAAQALAIELALKQKPPGSGAMSDPEFEYYLSSVPSLARTAEGRKQISQTLRAKAKRDAAIANMARSYAKKNNGVIDDAFFDEVAAYKASAPITTPGTSEVDSVMNKYPPRKGPQNGINR